MHTLLMPLVGPMQSWGYRSRFDDRDTGLEPTRSGVIGLVCAAMGIPRHADISRFDCLRMGVRIDAPGRVMVDYHTAKDVIKADPTKGTDNVQSWRHYLSDARFLVGLESKELILLEEIDVALRHPVWPLFLGRKSFVPALPVHLADSSVRRDTGLEPALREFPYFRLRERERMPTLLRIVMEPEPGEETYMAQSDWPLSYKTRSFGLRDIKTTWVEADNLQDGGVWPCISPA